MFWKVADEKKIKKWLHSLHDVDIKVEISNQSLTEKMAMIHFTEKELKTLKSMQPFVIEHLDYLVDQFYKTILNVEELKVIIHTHSNIERLRQTLRTHIVQLFNGVLDIDFIEKRKKVASIHFHIGLKPAWYMGAFQNLQKSFLELLSNEVEDRFEFIQMTKAVLKIFSLEQQIVLEEYESKNIQQRELQYEQVKQEIKQKIHATSKELVQLAEQTSHSINELVHTSTQVEDLVNKTTEQSQYAQQYTENGTHLIQELSTQIDEILQENESLNQTVQKLIASSTEITKVIRFVQEIADQTNLLALNSAIEAARAGEHGKGFAIVSEEVRKLADQTKQSVAQIESIIRASNDYAHTARHTLTTVNESVFTGKEKSTQTNDIFQHIATSIKKSDTSIHNVEKRVQQLAQTIQEISEAMEVVLLSAESLNETANLA